MPSLGMATWVRGQLARRLGAGALHDGISANIEYPFPGVLRWAILDAHRLATDPTAEAADPWRVDRLVWSVLEVLSDPPDDLDERLTRTGDRGHPRRSCRAARRPVRPVRRAPAADDPGLARRARRRRRRHPDRRQPGPGSRRSSGRCSATSPSATASLPRRPNASSTPSTSSARASSTSGPARPGPSRRDCSWRASRSSPPSWARCSARSPSSRDVTLLMLSPSARTSVEMAERTAAQRPRLPARAASWAIERSVAATGADLDAPAAGHLGAATARVGGAAGSGRRRARAAPSRRAPSPPPCSQRLQRDLHDGAIDGEPFVPTERGPVRAAPRRTGPHPPGRGAPRHDPRAAARRPDPDRGRRGRALPGARRVRPGAHRGARTAGRAVASSRRADTVPALRYAVVDRPRGRSTRCSTDSPRCSSCCPDASTRPRCAGSSRCRRCANASGSAPRTWRSPADWTDETRVRWGLDDRHRRRWGVEGDAGNSWQAALDGLLMGVALGDDLRDAALPGVARAARPDRRRTPSHPAAWPRCRSRTATSPQPDGWPRRSGPRSRPPAPRRRAEPAPSPSGSATCDATLDDLFAVPRFEDWQRSAVDELLAGLVCRVGDRRERPGAEPRAARAQPTYADCWRRRSRVRRARADLGYGSIVVARPSLLQSVPYRVVCVLGLDGDALPAGRDARRRPAAARADGR